MLLLTVMVTQQLQNKEGKIIENYLLNEIKNIFSYQIQNATVM